MPLRTAALRLKYLQWLAYQPPFPGFFDTGSISLADIAARAAVTSGIDRIIGADFVALTAACR